MSLNCAQRDSSSPAVCTNLSPQYALISTGLLRIAGILFYRADHFPHSCTDLFHAATRALRITIKLQHVVTEVLRINSGIFLKTPRLLTEMLTCYVLP